MMYHHTHSNQHKPYRQRKASRNIVTITSISLAIVLLATKTSFAQEDQRYRIQEEQRFIQTNKDNQLEHQTTITSPNPTANLDEQDTHSEQYITIALFTQINQANWQQVQTLLQQYQQLTEYSDVVVYFAKGSLARAKGQLNQAEKYFHQMLAIDPEFHRGRLELARALFENKKFIAAKQNFEQVYPLMPSNIQHIITIYQNAINQQKQWQSSLNLGLLYQDNINQKSGQSKCYGTFIYNGQQFCANLRQSESPIHDWGYNYYITNKKYIPIKDQHQIEIKATAYGTIYDTQSDYSQHNLNTSIGYRYQNYKNNITIAPFYERNHYDSKSLYQGYGLRLDYGYRFTPKHQLDLQTEWQNNQFFNQRLAQYNNGHTLSLYATMQHQINNSTWVFWGVNLYQKNIKDQTFSYHQLGTRLGLYKVFNNQSTLTAITQYRQSNYQAANQFIDNQPPKNKEWIYLLSYAMPRYNIKGFYPVIGFRYNQVRSNIPWFYNYHNTEVSLKLQKEF